MRRPIFFIVLSTHFLLGIRSASEGSDTYMRPKVYSRLEGSVPAKADGSYTGFIAVIELNMNDSTVKPTLLGAIISKRRMGKKSHFDLGWKGGCNCPRLTVYSEMSLLGLETKLRHILTTANLLDQNVWASQGLSINSIDVSVKVLGGNATKFVNLTTSDVINHPKYVTPNATSSEDDFLESQPAILTLNADVAIGIDNELRSIPISCSINDTSVYSFLAIYDWAKSSTEDGFELWRAYYFWKNCPANPSFTKEWSLCFQFVEPRMYNVSDMGILGSPIVRDSLVHEKAALIAVKARTYNVSATESLTSATSMSYSEIYKFVCQYADVCINNGSAATTITEVLLTNATSSTVVTSTTAVTPTTTANVTSTAATETSINVTTATATDGNTTITGTGNNNATTLTSINNTTTATNLTVDVTIIKSNATTRRYDYTGPDHDDHHQDEDENKWSSFMQLINNGIRYFFG
ncbi:unnamed protein product [Notodromas monacha]|uniref:Uncharacterized protein n=1 Tax=Notodromas monacha TaxID=399045 RepID=A0A7R9GH37_9CRUS|nr:unnamed protein product [Notodromas monacha]CAG0920894.1 unnamed protein product [Notodromas monacha]